MVKAKEFWKYLCEGLDYRLFAGVPCLGLNPLYKVMNKELLHYMPAVNERTAVGIVMGGYLAGAKGGVLVSSEALIGLGNEINIIKSFNTPILIIVYTEDSKLNYPFWHVELTDKFEPALKKIANRNKPSILTIKEGVLI